MIAVAFGAFALAVLAGWRDGVGGVIMTLLILCGIMLWAVVGFLRRERPETDAPSATGEGASALVIGRSQ